MTRALQLVVLIVLLVVLAVSLGCPKRGQTPVTSAGGPAAGPPGGPASSGPGETTPAAGETGKDEGPAADFAAKHAQLKSYIMTMTIDGKDMGKHYMKMENGKPVAMKADIPGGTGYMLMLMDKNVTYMVDPKAKTAMKMESPNKEAEGSEGEMPGMSNMPKMSDLKDLEAPAWTTDTLDGVECWKHTTPGAAGASATVWIDKEYGLPRQMQTGKQVILHKYDKINAVPDSEFVLPKDIKVTEGMPGMPNMPKM